MHEVGDYRRLIRLLRAEAERDHYKREMGRIKAMEPGDMDSDMPGMTSMACGTCEEMIDIATKALEVKFGA